MSPNDVDEYRKNVAETIFACMELSKQSYLEIIEMPVKRLHDYLKWKDKLEEEKQKIMEEEASKI